MDNVFMTKTAGPEVGEFFRIDRKVIKENKEEIHRKCEKEGKVGKAVWERFEESNEIADTYPRLIETYIFKYKEWFYYEYDEKLENVCRNFNLKMCDEVIADLELQMRICNGESAHDLLQEPDKLPRVRRIKCRNGKKGYVGGGAVDNNGCAPAYISSTYWEGHQYCTLYGWRCGSL